jgi:hypothetical protein
MRTYLTNQELLTRRVEAVNKINNYAKRLQNQVFEILLPYKGKKIVKTSGSYRELIKKIVMPEQEEGFRYWFRISEYRVDIECDCTYSTSDTSISYSKQSIHVCTLQNGTELKELSDGEYVNKFREDFTFNEIWEKRKKISELNDEIGRIETSILQFQKSDF